MVKSGAMGTFRLAGLGMLTVAAVSCGQKAGDQSQLKIYGGKKTTSGEWLSTVAITGANGRMFCSGTAINPRLVITAAHCVQGSDNPNSLRVYTGDGTEGGAVSPQYKTVKFAYSPKYGRNPGGWNDIAYLVLDHDLNLPANAYVPVLTDETEIKELLKAGVTSHIVGFGNRDGGGFGVKYEADAPITTVNDIEVGIGNNGKDSCQGDSGGPAYGQLKSGEWRVYGIVSRGGACGLGGIWGLMHANICWVEKDSGVKLGLPAGFCDKDAPTPPTDETPEIDPSSVPGEEPVTAPTPSI